LICVLPRALFAFSSRSTMYEIVESAYKVTLVCAFVPLAAGIWWKPATVQGALARLATRCRGLDRLRGRVE
jgi:Na+/proline symporter